MTFREIGAVRMPGVLSWSSAVATDYPPVAWLASPAGPRACLRGVSSGAGVAPAEVASVALTGLACGEVALASGLLVASTFVLRSCSPGRSSPSWARIRPFAARAAGHPRPRRGPAPCSQASAMRTSIRSADASSHCCGSRHREPAQSCSGKSPVSCACGPTTPTSSAALLLYLGLNPGPGGCSTGVHNAHRDRLADRNADFRRRSRHRHQRISVLPPPLLGIYGIRSWSSAPSPATRYGGR